jgi:hypothetical protein
MTKLVLINPTALKLVSVSDRPYCHNKSSYKPFVLQRKIDQEYFELFSISSNSRHVRVSFYISLGILPCVIVGIGVGSLFLRCRNFYKTILKRVPFLPMLSSSVARPLPYPQNRNAIPLRMDIETVNVYAQHFYFECLVLVAVMAEVYQRVRMIHVHVCDHLGFLFN